MRLQKTQGASRRSTWKRIAEEPANKQASRRTDCKVSEKQAAELHTAWECWRDSKSQVGNSQHRIASHHVQSRPESRIYATPPIQHLHAERSSRPALLFPDRQANMKQSRSRTKNRGGISQPSLPQRQQPRIVISIPQAHYRPVQLTNSRTLTRGAPRRPQRRRVPYQPAERSPHPGTAAAGG